MSKILGFAGCRQSGKNTCCNFITMLKFLEYGVSERVKMGTDGEILVSDIYGEKPNINEEYFPFTLSMVDQNAVINSLSQVKTYAMADELKMLCSKLFNIPISKIYGTDKDKNSPTNLKWGDMPTSIIYSNDSEYDEIYGNLDAYGMADKFDFIEQNRSNQYMTIREVLQYIGTEIFRQMNPDIWADTTLRTIQKENFPLALICDVRFDNEFEIIHKYGGKIIGLTRNYNPDAKHASEQVNLDLCDIVIDNVNMTLDQQNKALYDIMKELNYDIINLG